MAGPATLTRPRMAERISGTVSHGKGKVYGSIP